MSWLLNIIIFLAVITILVGVHEWGHYITARVLGIKVLRFSIGFGKPLFRYSNKHDTEYVLGMLPFGGYVRLLDTREADVPASEQPFAFDKQAVWKRMLVVLAGPGANILFAVIAYWMMFVVGVDFIEPTIGAVKVDSIAADARLLPGMEITHVDGRYTPGWQQVVIGVLNHVGDQDNMVVTANTRAGSQQFYLDLQSWPKADASRQPLRSLGIKPSGALRYNRVQYAPTQAVVPALQETAQFVSFNFVMIGKLLTGKLALHVLGGPIGIFNSAGAAFYRGTGMFLEFLAILSIGLAIINLLPIPGLDGGQFVYLLYEGVVRREVSLGVQVLLFRLGIIVLVVLSVQVLINDLMRLMQQ